MPKLSAIRQNSEINRRTISQNLGINMTQSDGRPSAEALAKNQFQLFNRNQASLDTDRNLIDKRKQQMFNVPVPSLQLQNV